MATADHARSAANRPCPPAVGPVVAGPPAERVREAVDAALHPAETPVPRPETVAEISRVLSGSIDALLLHATARRDRYDRGSAGWASCQNVIRDAEAVRRLSAGAGLLSAVSHSRRLAGAVLALLELAAREQESGQRPRDPA